MKKYTYFTLHLLFTSPSLAQVLPSPAAMGTVREASVPVNLYTGIPQISVPLYTLPHHAGHAIPVHLSYHAGGHKVQDVAGPIGLAWTMHAGGMITRVVRGRPDDYLGILHPTTLQDYQDISEGVKDGAHDLYYFSLPGRSGMFIRKPASSGNTPEGSLVYEGFTFPKSNLKITYVEISRGRWIITDEQGNRYYFGNHEGTEAYDVTTSNKMENGEYTSANEQTYVSTWYLTKIDYYNSPHDVVLEYETGSEYEYEYFDNMLEIDWRKERIGATGNTKVVVDDHEITKANTKISVASRYLSKISSQKGEVRFKWSTGRRDILDRYLDEVSLHVKNSAEPIDAYSFSYTTLDSYTAPYDDQGPDHFYPYSTTNHPRANPSFYIDGKDKNRYRLQLDQIEKNGQHYRKFDYFGEGENQRNAFNETYNANNLPPRDAVSVDYLGYSNGDAWVFQFQEGFTPIHDLRFEHLNTSVGDQNVLIGGASRYPNASTFKANVLKRIYYPEAGYTEFEYEQHIHEENTLPIPGVRVSAIISHDGEDVENRVTYTYSDSHINGRGSPAMTFWENDGDIFISDDLTREDHALTIVHSHSTTQLFDVNGSYITYGTVVESREGYGKTAYTFFDQEDYPDETPDYDVVGIDIAIHNYNGPPYTPNTSLAYTRGMLKSKIDFIYEDGEYKKLSEQVVDYYSVEDFFPAFVWSNTRVYYLARYKELGFESRLWNNLTSWFRSPTPPREDAFIEGRYQVLYEPVLPKSILNRIYDKDHPAHYSETLTTFNYDGANELISTSMVQTNADGTQNKVETTAVVDIAPTSDPSPSTTEVKALWVMRKENRLGFPVETIRLFRESSLDRWTVLSSQYHEYEEAGSPATALPGKTFGLMLPNPVLETSFNKAALSGTSISKSADYEPLTSFDYTADQEISRAYDLMSDQTTDYEYDGESYIKTIKYDPLNDLNRKTDYTTKPLIGTETVTDMNSKSVTYEYDSRNRLHLIRDQDDNIVERYWYNYGAENNGSGAEIQVSGAHIINNTLTFSTINKSIYGEQMTEYHWYLDGMSKNGPSVSHSFSSPGIKTIQLRIINPEYEDPLQASLSIFVDPY
ncbi:MAG: hypothetical protein AAGI25_02705 [Bacteroidota bacterium]